VVAPRLWVPLPPVWACTHPELPSLVLPLLDDTPQDARLPVARALWCRRSCVEKCPLLLVAQVARCLNISAYITTGDSTSQTTNQPVVLSRREAGENEREKQPVTSSGKSRCQRRNPGASREECDFGHSQFEGSRSSGEHTAPCRHSLGMFHATISGRPSPLAVNVHDI
jgi:hypothetical protein